MGQRIQEDPEDTVLDSCEDTLTPIVVAELLQLASGAQTRGIIGQRSGPNIR